MAAGKVGGIFAAGCQSIGIAVDEHRLRVPAWRAGPDTPTHVPKIYSNPVSSPEDANLTGTYVRVLILEAIIILALWLMGRAFVPLP